MFIYAPRITTSLFVIGITGTAAKLGNYNNVGNIDDTIAGFCAEAKLSKSVGKLCKELGPNGLDLGLDETINLIGGPEGLRPTFTMREILAAKDVEVKFHEIQARNQKQTERKLFVDYGWCSGSPGVIWGDDSSNYCADDQTCDSWDGCDTDLSGCCINHDKCLQATEYGSTDKCPGTNCKGSTCDANLAACAYAVSCCSGGGGWWGCDFACVTSSTAIAGLFGNPSLSPKMGQNTDGADTDAICSA